MELADLGEAREVYEKALWCDGKNPSCWISVGALYNEVGQWRDSLDALARSVELNSTAWEAWMNLGILVCRYRPLRAY